MMYFDEHIRFFLLFCLKPKLGLENYNEDFASRLSHLYSEIDINGCLLILEILTPSLPLFASYMSHILHIFFRLQYFTDFYVCDKKKSSLTLLTSVFGDKPSLLKV